MTHFAQSIEGLLPTQQQVIQTVTASTPSAVNVIQSATCALITHPASLVPALTNEVLAAAPAPTNVTQTALESAGFHTIPHRRANASS